MTGGRAAVAGDYVVPDVPGSGAEILMNWRGTVGSRYGSLLPTGSASNVVHMSDRRPAQMSFVDAGNPCL